LNKLLKTRLREHALILRDLAAALRSAQAPKAEAISTLRAKKEELMHEIYTVMTATLGVPPMPDAKFSWDYYDKDGKAFTWEGTPKQFYKVDAHACILEHPS
jgi:bleomycin hydrolase